MRIWKIAPPNCLQYITESTGTVKSFNWKDVAASATSQRQLADQDYLICFRTELVGNSQQVSWLLPGIPNVRTYLGIQTNLYLKGSKHSLSDRMFDNQRRPGLQFKSSGYRRRNEQFGRERRDISHRPMCQWFPILSRRIRRARKFQRSILWQSTQPNARLCHIDAHLL
jgi:hypothetical protein